MKEGKEEGQKRGSFSAFLNFLFPGFNGGKRIEEFPSGRESRKRISNEVFLLFASHVRGDLKRGGGRRGRTSTSYSTLRGGKKRKKEKRRGSWGGREKRDGSSLTPH